MTANDAIWNTATISREISWRPLKRNIRYSISTERSKRVNRFASGGTDQNQDEPTKNVAKYEALRIVGRPLTRCTGKKSKAQRSAAVLHIFIVSSRAHSSRRDTMKG